MRVNRNIILLFGVIGILLILFACNREACKLHEGVNSKQMPALTKELTAEIFFDASYSMYGFVKYENSFYTRTLQLLVRSFFSGWPDGNIIYNKFGSKISQIQRKNALEATKVKFYCDPDFSKETHIENVIGKAKQDDLTLIITDLFQDDADVNLVIERLNERFLSKGLSIGILGLKSEFNGIVCDVGLQGLNFDYKTAGKKPKDFRPFFVLMLGKYRDIEHFYEKLKANGLESFPEKKFLVFSSHLVESLASFENSRLSETKKIKEVTTILPTNTLNSRVRQFIVQGNPQEAYFESIIALNPLPYTMTFNPQKLQVETKAWQCSKQDLLPNKDVVRGFVLKNPVVSGTQLKLSTEIIPANFPGNGTYCFEITISPAFNAYSLPPWVSDWDMNLNMLESWKQNPKTFNGASTLNLKNFLNNIWQIIYQRYKPKIARLYCYIKKG